MTMHLQFDAPSRNRTITYFPKFMSDNRPKFASKFGVIAATVGSAVGLGNIWRYPYEAGANGGGVFVLVNILCVLLIGIPVVCSEFVIGKAGRNNIFGAMQKLAPRGGQYWRYVGFCGLTCTLLILAFYSVVAGWTLEYLFQSVTGRLTFVSSVDSHQVFGAFTSGWRCVFWTVVLMAINTCIALRGVRKGIEKASNVMMPVLFVLLLIMGVNSLLLPGAREGLEFLFRPDWSKATPSMFLSALGQAFFSLSIGMGTLVVYGSYFPDNVKIVKSASIMAVLDTLVAVMAAAIIFPAVFSFGMEPSAGPRLVFEVFPDIFRMMPLGAVWSTMFFLLLLIAALTSTLSLSESGISFCVDQWKMSRRRATLLTMGVITSLAVVCAMSFGVLSDFKIFGFTVFDLFDFVTSNILMPFGGMLVSIFVGWIIRRATLNRELRTAPRILCGLIIFSLRWLSPLAILAIFINNLIG